MSSDYNFQFHIFFPLLFYKSLRISKHFIWTNIKWMKENMLIRESRLSALRNLIIHNVSSPIKNSTYILSMNNYLANLIIVTWHEQLSTWRKRRFLLSLVCSSLSSFVRDYSEFTAIRLGVSLTLTLCKDTFIPAIPIYNREAFLRGWEGGGGPPAYNAVNRNC